MTLSSRRARAATVGLALLAVALVPAIHLPATAASTSLADLPGTNPPAPVTTLGDPVDGLDPIDAATAARNVVQQTRDQELAAARLGRGVQVLWNDSGTPASILPADGSLGPADSTSREAAEASARRWLVTHLDVLGISAAQVAGLERVSYQPLAGTRAWAVLFRQRFGELTPATRSMVTVGVADDTITYVSSSLTKTTGVAPAAGLSARAGWLLAAESVGRTVPADRLSAITGAVSEGWTRLQVPGFSEPQLARLRAFALPDGSVRPVIEANVVDVVGGSSTAYRVMVDAVDETVLLRQNAVHNSSDVVTANGSYTATACSAPAPFELTDDRTRTILVAAAAVVAADDITIKVFGPGGTFLGSYDLLTSPETAQVSAPQGSTLPMGTYSIQVCPFDATAVGGPYTATITTSDQEGPAGAPALPAPRWRYFAANPALSSIGSTEGAPTNSVVGCYSAATPGCSPREDNRSVADLGPWDQVDQLSTLTTFGNNAQTREAWASFLTPGGAAQAPISLTREYTDGFTDAWNNSGCGLDNFTPGGNDILAATTNLFSGHNKFHDFSYYLGFTEENFNLQLDNGGRGGVAGDQEIGNVQAGAATGGAAGMYMGRDNANQITLQDGVPGITNQYLFQPIAGAFYSPCTDGSFDTGIYGHEYTHATSNRMVGGPDDGLTSEQGSAMGESWSDMVAAEYQFEKGYTLDPAAAVNPWSLGSYATGNFVRGIRDFAINDNPLNFSNYGFDLTGPEFHADGEIWNAALWEVRQALVNRYDTSATYDDAALQERCSRATATSTPPPGTSCPGNRRWLQLIFDSFLLQPGATDMLQARNAMIAADQMRFGGDNRDLISAAFARRGMGADASTAPDDVEPVPSFRSSFGNNSGVTFTGVGNGEVFVGNYEARVRPVADLDPASGLPATATFTPGVYRMTYASPTQGFRRFVLTVPDDGRGITVPIDDAATNVASSGAGATVIGQTEGSLNADLLIDGTESTNWGVTTAANVDESRPFVAVDLAGGVQTITSAKVSALLRPVTAAEPGVDEDPASGSRFTALRRFALEACVTACETPGATWSTFYTSAADAFPGDVPRPVAPDQTMRSFVDFAPTRAAAVRLRVLENQCTGQDRYAGEQDQDPSNDTDCKTASDRGTIVHATELQLFAAPVPTDPAEAPAGDGGPGSGTAGQGNSALPLPGQPGLGTVTAGSTAGTTAGTAAAKGPTRTKTRIRLPRVQQVRGRESTPLTYSVVAKQTSAGATAGTVVVRMDGRKVRTTKVPVTLKSGRTVVGKTYRIPKGLGLGTHTFVVRFRPSDSTVFRRSSSRKIVITVVRSRPAR